MQEWFVRERSAPPVVAVEFDGAAGARPAPGVLEAIDAAETILVCPSNPIISIGPILAVPGVRAALEARRDRVVAVSPIIAGATVKGPADRLMGPLGIDVSCVGVARTYAPFCSTLVIDERDAGRAADVAATGVRPVVAETLMTDARIAAALAQHALDVARWALGVDYPTRVTSAGGKFRHDDDQETPDSGVAMFHFGDKAIAWDCSSCHPRRGENLPFVSFFVESIEIGQRKRIEPARFVIIGVVVHVTGDQQQRRIEQKVFEHRRKAACEVFAARQRSSADADADDLRLWREPMNDRQFDFDAVLLLMRGGVKLQAGNCGDQRASQFEIGFQLPTRK